MKYFKICDQTIHLYTCVLVSNAMLKDIIANDDGNTKLVYKELDSNPMYISYTVHKTLEDAQNQVANFSERKEQYKNALTVSEYLKHNL